MPLNQIKSPGISEPPALDCTLLFPKYNKINSLKGQASNKPCLDRHYGMFLHTEHAPKVMLLLQKHPVNIKETRH